VVEEGQETPTARDFNNDGSADLRVPVRSRSRAIRVLLLFIAALGLLAFLVSTKIWWLDAAYLGLTFAWMIAFSVRILFARWRSDVNDVTKYGGLAAYPKSWQRWLTDEYPEGPSRPGYNSPENVPKH
jgi:phosphoglycerol transferase MdoB-like AlkP superfamily enzyme